MAKSPNTKTAPGGAPATSATDEWGAAHLYVATFAKRLRELREEKGLSKSDLAKLVWGTTTDSRGYTVAKNRDRISVYEDGSQAPTPENLKAIATALGVSTGELAPDLVTNSHSSRKPAVSMTLVDGQPDRAVLSVNCQMSLTLAAQIIQMIAGDPIAAGALK